MYLLAAVTQLSQERPFLRFLRPVNMARSLLVDTRRGGFQLSKIGRNATITRHSGDEIQTTEVVNIK